MSGLLGKVTGFCFWLEAIQVIAPARAEPYFVTVYGRTFKLDTEAKPREALKALPPDIVRGPGFKPPSAEVLAEVEERLWIVRTQLEDAGATVSDEKRTIAVGRRGVAQASEVKSLTERRAALETLARELRRYIGVPLRPLTPGEFSAPKLSPEVVASYRDFEFDPLSAYYAFRMLKAAFRSGDISLISRVVRYPVTISGRIRRVLRNPEQLHAAERYLLDPRLRAVAAASNFDTLFVRDKGVMLAQGEIWLTHGKDGFALQEVNLE